MPYYFTKDQVESITNNQLTTQEVTDIQRDLTQIIATSSRTRLGQISQILGGLPQIKNIKYNANVTEKWKNAVNSRKEELDILIQLAKGQIVHLKETNQNLKMFKRNLFVGTIPILFLLLISICSNSKMEFQTQLNLTKEPQDKAENVVDSTKEISASTKSDIKEETSNTAEFVLKIILLIILSIISFAYIGSCCRWGQTTKCRAILNGILEQQMIKHDQEIAHLYTILDINYEQLQVPIPPAPRNP